MAKGLYTQCLVPAEGRTESAVRGGRGRGSVGDVFHGSGWLGCRGRGIGGHGINWEGLTCVPDRHQAWFCVQSPSDHELVRSSLLHDGLLATDLTLDLLSSPPSRVLSAVLEFAVGLGLPDHGRQPVGSEHINKLAARVGVSQITRKNR